MNPEWPDQASRERALRRSSLSRAARLPAFTLMAALAGCTTPSSEESLAGRNERVVGDSAFAGDDRLANVSQRDKSLWEYRYALGDIRDSDYEEAARLLDDALARLEGIVGNSDADARRSRSLFSAESVKPFVGEPYERAMAWYYRGLLYWKAGEIDNARASFRSAEFADSVADETGNRGDYVLFDYLDGLASTRLAADGSDAFARAQERTTHELPPYDQVGNVLVFVDFGVGPRKVAGGDYGEKLQFRPGPTRAHSARLSVAGQTLDFIPWDDLQFQATTRGDRVMDYILGNKAVFKEGADAFGDVALVGAQIAADNIYRKKEEPRREEPPKPARRDVSRRNTRQPDPPAEKPEGKKPPEKQEAAEVEKNENAERAAFALGVVGILSKIAAAATIPTADTRTWDNLPQYLSFGSLDLPPGDYEATLEFFDASERPIDSLTRHPAIRVDGTGRDSIVILSEHLR